MAKVTFDRLMKMKLDGQKIASLTAYDSSFAIILDEAGVELTLVGDSLGMVIHGRDNTLGVTMENMIYHLKQVARVTKHALVIGDMPYQSYQYPEHALANARRLVREGGAETVKLERGENQVCRMIEHIARHDIKVCGHLGLTPQSFAHRREYKLQGREAGNAKQIKKQALDLQNAGASMLVIEYVPASLAADITDTLDIPVIGIGAGGDCDGQILVTYDMLGMYKYQPKATRNFLTESTTIQDAVSSYISAVKSGEFPARENQFD